MRLRWLLGVVHAEGGGVMMRSWGLEGFKADDGPATSALQVSVVVPEHSETGRMFVDTVHSDGIIVCAVVGFRGAGVRDWDESKKIGM